MFTRTVILFLILGLSHCKTPNRGAVASDPTQDAAAGGEENGHGFQLVEDKYSKELVTYSLDVKAKDNVLQGIFRLVAGQDCFSKLTVSFSEMQKNARGADEQITQDSDYDLNWFA